METKKIHGPWGQVIGEKEVPMIDAMPAPRRQEVVAPVYFKRRFKSVSQLLEAVEAVSESIGQSIRDNCYLNRPFAGGDFKKLANGLAKHKADSDEAGCGPGPYAKLDPETGCIFRAYYTLNSRLDYSDGSNYPDYPSFAPYALPKGERFLCGIQWAIAPDLTCWIGFHRPGTISRNATARKWTPCDGLPTGDKSSALY